MKRIVVLPVILMLIFTAKQSVARSVDLGGGVMTPPFETRPDLGIQRGAFLIFPQLTAGMEYNDNIYYTKNDKKSDFIASIEPRVVAASIWSRHNLKLDAGIDDGLYLDHSRENYLNAHILTEGRLDIVQESYAKANLGYESYYEGRGSRDSLRAWDEPARYTRLTGGGSVHHEMGRFFVNAGGEAVDYRFGKAHLIDGGIDNQSTRDRNEYNVDARLGYEWLPKIKPFIQSQFNWRRYDKEDLAQRDSKGYRIGAGTKIYMGGITTGEVYGGYLSQNYDKGDDVAGLWYGLSLVWDVTRLTSIRAGVERLVEETTQPGASGIATTEVNVKMDHELRRNISVGLDLSYIHDTYKGVDITDKYYKATPHLTYFFNRNFSTALEYEYAQRDSSQDELIREYRVNRVSVLITGSF